MDNTVFEKYKKEFIKILKQELKNNKLYFIDPGISTGVLLVKGTTTTLFDSSSIIGQVLTLVGDKADMSNFFSKAHTFSKVLFTNKEDVYKLIIEDYRVRSGVANSSSGKINLQERLIGYLIGLTNIQEKDLILVQPSVHKQIITEDKFEFACNLLGLKTRTQHEKDTISMFVWFIESKFKKVTK